MLNYDDIEVIKNIVKESLRERESAIFNEHTEDDEAYSEQCQELGNTADEIYELLLQFTAALRTSGHYTLVQRADIAAEILGPS